MLKILLINFNAIRSWKNDRNFNNETQKKQKITEEGNNLIEFAKELFRDRNWNLAKHFKGGEEFYILKQSKKGRLYKIVTNIDLPFNLLNEIYFDPLKLPQWCSFVTKNEIFEKIDSNTQIIYSIVPSNIFINQSDYVNLNKVATDFEFIVNTSCSISYEKIPPTQNYKRGEKNFTAIFFEPISNNGATSRLTWIVNVPSSTWLPNKLFDLAMCPLLYQQVKNLQKIIVQEQLEKKKDNN